MSDNKELFLLIIVILLIVIATFLGALLYCAANIMQASGCIAFDVMT